MGRQQPHLNVDLVEDFGDVVVAGKHQHLVAEFELNRAGTEGERWSCTPTLGLFHATTGVVSPVRRSYVKYLGYSSLFFGFLTA